MLNSTLIGGHEAREALAQASLKLEVGTDWCVGACEPWVETEDGRERYKALQKINEEREAAGLTHV